MTYRIWFNTKDPDPQRMWVIQGKAEPHLIMAPSVICSVPLTFKSDPSGTPMGWAEGSGWLSVDGTTNAVYLRGD